MLSAYEIILGLHVVSLMSDQKRHMPTKNTIPLIIRLNLYPTNVNTGSIDVVFLVNDSHVSGLSYRRKREEL